MWCPFWRKFPKSTRFKNTNLARGAGDDDGVDDEEDDWDEEAMMMAVLVLFFIREVFPKM